MARYGPCKTLQTAWWRQSAPEAGPSGDSQRVRGRPTGCWNRKRLVFGERRLEAARFLGWETIPARVIEIERIVDGEYAENEMRKAFTQSERIAIGKAVEGELGNRQGQRTDQPGENIPKVEPGKRAADLAAEKAGFGNRRTYEAAKKVVEQAAAEVVAKMDCGDLSISAAAVIADQPEAEQKRIAGLPEKERKAEVATLEGRFEPRPGALAAACGGGGGRLYRSTARREPLSLQRVTRR